MMETEKETEKVYAIVLAGGTGSRMGSDIPKQYMPLLGKPMIAHSLIAFEKSAVDKIFVVCGREYQEMIKSSIIDRYGITKLAGFAENGAERVYSVRNGIEAALAGGTDCSPEDIFLLIHDGARPLISQSLIQSCIDAVKVQGAVIPAIPLKDTIKEVEGNKVKATPDRSMYMAVQTPQCFRADIISRAYEAFGKNAALDQVPTDDASLVEIFTDISVNVIPGEESNIKITTPRDLSIAQIMMQE